MAYKLMDVVFVTDLIRQTCLTLFKVSAPILIVAFVVGLFISFFQALTQIQEATISFVPKLVVILCTAFLSFDYMLTQIMHFSYNLFYMIQNPNTSP